MINKIKNILTVFLLALSLFLPEAPILGQSTQPDSTDRPTIFEPLLILSYDSDTGFGYGAKAFLLNPFKIRESFDLILFNSTKGERWYRLVFSLPDFELRQGKAYPIAFDFIVDYDKYVARSFFGIGNNSSYEDREKYTRRDVEFSPTLTRGLTSRLIAQIGYRFKSIDSYNFDPEGSMKDIPPPQNITVITNHSFFLSFRYDSRNSLYQSGFREGLSCRSRNDQWYDKIPEVGDLVSALQGHFFQANHIRISYGPRGSEWQRSATSGIITPGWQQIFTWLSAGPVSR